MSATPDGSAAHEHARARRIVPVVAGLCIGLLLAALDQTVFATALPTIVGEFGDPGRVAWINTAYVLAATLVMPIYGRLGDLYGRRPTYVGALLIFIGASVVAALAPSASVLVAARFAQGLGGGGLLVLVQAIVADLVPARARAPYLALIGAVFAIASVAGPLLGGALTEGIGWRWAFWINVPFGLLAVVLALTTYAERRSPPVRAPLLPLRVLARRDVVIATSAGLLLAVAMFGTVAYLPTYLQLVDGLSPTSAGLVMTALAAGIAVTTLTAARILRTTGRYRLLPVLGAAIATAAVLGLSTRPVDGSLVVTGALLFVLGLGIGCTWDVLLLIVQNGQSPDTVGAATATYSFFREVGVTIGTALVGVLFAARLTDLMHALPGAQVPVATEIDRLTPHLVHALPPATRDAVVTAYHDALLPAVGMTAPFLLVAALVLCFLTGAPLATSAPQPGSADHPFEQD